MLKKERLDKRNLSASTEYATYLMGWLQRVAIHRKSLSRPRQRRSSMAPDLHSVRVASQVQNGRLLMCIARAATEGRHRYHVRCIRLYNHVGLLQSLHRSEMHSCTQAIAFEKWATNNIVAYPQCGSCHEGDVPVAENVVVAASGSAA